MILLSKNAKEFWQVDGGKNRPLYRQLEDLIREWISRSEIGERLPAELDIAKWASVTRKTVRKALQRFMDEKYFIRRARVGTVLVKKAAIRFEPPHPFEQSPAFGPIAGQALKLVLFAGTEVRRAYWTEVIEGYNRDHSLVKISPVWTPIAVCSGNDYQTFIEQEEADLVYVGDRQVTGFIDRGFLQRLSPGIVRDLRSDAFLSESLYAQRTTELDYAAPLNFPLWGVLTDEDMVTRAGKEVPALFRYSSLISWLAKLENVPELFATVGKLVSSGGIPADGVDDACLTEWLRKRLAPLSRLKKISHLIKWFDSKPYESVEKFLAGRTAVYIGNLYPLTDYLSRVPFRWNCSIIKTDATFRLPTGFNNLAIPACCKNPSLAENFINYMISDHVMERMATIFRYGVFRKESNRVLSESLFRKSDESKIQAAIETHIVHNEFYEKWSVFFEHQWKDTVRELITGDINADHAVDVIMRDYQSFRNRKICDIAIHPTTRREE